MHLTDILQSFPLATGMWIGIISTVVSVIGTGISVYGGMQSANAAEAAASAEAAESRRMANKEAETAAENARRAEREKTRLLATQRAALARSGLAMEGTPLAVLGETAATLELDILDIGHAAAMKRRALLAGASVAEAEGASAATSLRTQAAGDAVSGLSSAATSYGKSAGYLK